MEICQWDRPFIEHKGSAKELEKFQEDPALELRVNLLKLCPNSQKNTLKTTKNLLNINEHFPGIGSNSHKIRKRYLSTAFSDFLPNY